MPEPGMGSGGARGGAGMGGGGRSGRDEPGSGTLLSGESVGSVLGSDPRAGGKVGGYYSHERGRWVGGTSPIKASPEESFSAIPAVAPVAKPASRIEMYLDETPALKVEAVPAVKNPFKDLVAETNTEKQSRLNKNAATRQQNDLTQTSMMAGADYSGAAAANKAEAERERTMSATMGGGPSYDPLFHSKKGLGITERIFADTEMNAASKALFWERYNREIAGYKDIKWDPNWSESRKRDFLASQDKTLGAAKQHWKDVTAASWEEAEELFRKYSPQSKHSKYGKEFDFLEDEALRDVLRHGIMTNKVGIGVASLYETFKSGMQISDYINNYTASEFAKTLAPNQDFNEAWAAMVTQERNNPGSTGWNIDWSAGTNQGTTDLRVGQLPGMWMDQFKNTLKSWGNDLAMGWSHGFKTDVTRPMTDEQQARLDAWRANMGEDGLLAQVGRQAPEGFQ